MPTVSCATACVLCSACAKHSEDGKALALVDEALAKGLLVRNTTHLVVTYAPALCTARVRACMHACMHTHMYAHIVDVCIFMYLRSFMILQHMRIPGVIGTRCMAVLAVAYAARQANKPKRLEMILSAFMENESCIGALELWCERCSIALAPVEY